MAEQFETIVIGGGQAGLAMGHELSRQGRHYVILDASYRIGDAWRNRWDSLTLFTPRAYSALPGLPMDGDPDGYPGKDEMAGYLEAYAEHFALPVRLNTKVTALDREDAKFTVTTERGTLEAKTVVIATGAFQAPSIPGIASDFRSDVIQLTATSYKNPSQVPAGTVLVVGDGATGRQIALEFAGTHTVLLATGRPRNVSPDRIFGRSVFWWLDRLGIVRAPRESRIGKRLKARDPFPGRHLTLPRLRAAGVALMPRLTRAEGRTARFDDGHHTELSAVVWATGYRDDTSWISIAGAKRTDGTVIEERGVSPVHGMYFVGRSWQWTRGSALVLGVGRDAAYIGHYMGSAEPAMPITEPGTTMNSAPDRHGDVFDPAH